MKVACVCDDRFPSSNANTQQVVKTASAVARHGVDIDLVLPRMWQTFGLSESRRRALINEYYSVSGPYGLQQIVSWIPTSFRFHKLSHGVVGPLATWLTGYDVMYTRNFLPVLFGLATGQLVVFETYRLLAKHYPALRKLMVAIANHPRFLGLVTHSKLARDNMVEAGIPGDKVKVLHNGYDREDLEPRLSRAEARLALNENLGWDLKGPVAVYTGRVDPDKGMDILLDIAGLCPNVQFVFVGATHRRERSWLEKNARSRGLDNVYRSLRVDPKTLATFLYAGDVLLIPPTSGPLEKRGNTVLPIKTFTYLGAGRPIVAPTLEDTAELLIHEHNSLLVPPDDPKAAAEAVKRLVRDSTLWERVEKNARADGAQLTWEARAQKFIAYLKERIQAYEDGLT